MSLAIDLAEAVAKDEAEGSGFDLSGGLFGPNVSALVLTLDAELTALRGAATAPAYGSARAIRECGKHEWPTDPPSADGAECCHCGAVYQA
jgi:hypothetical protein